MRKWEKTKPSRRTRPAAAIPIRTMRSQSRVTGAAMADDSLLMVLSDGIPRLDGCGVADTTGDILPRQLQLVRGSSGQPPCHPKICRLDQSPSVESEQVLRSNQRVRFDAFQKQAKSYRNSRTSRGLLESGPVGRRSPEDIIAEVPVQQEAESVGRPEAVAD